MAKSIKMQPRASSCDCGVYWYMRQPMKQADKEKKGQKGKVRTRVVVKTIKKKYDKATQDWMDRVAFYNKRSGKMR